MFTNFTIIPRVCPSYYWSLLRIHLVPKLADDPESKSVRVYWVLTVYDSRPPWVASPLSLYLRFLISSLSQSISLYVPPSSRSHFPPVLSSVSICSCFPSFLVLSLLSIDITLVLWLHYSSCQSSPDTVENIWWAVLPTSSRSSFRLPWLDQRETQETM